MPLRSFPADLSAKTLFQALPDPSILLNASGETLGWNTAFEHEMRLCPDLIERCETAMMQKAEARLTVRTDSGRTYYARLGVLSDRGDQLMRLRPADPSERQLEALRRFGASAGHDLQEPVRKMLAFSSLLSKRYGANLDADGLQSLEFIGDAAQRMRTLVNDLLAYIDVAARRLNPGPVSLDALWTEVVASRADRIEATGAEIRQTPLPDVEGDRALLRQALEALLDNALKFRRGPGVQISVTALRDDAHHRIEVRDDGIGVDPALAGKLFTPFGRLHPRESYPGTALGLAQTQLILERHGGAIWLEPGSGEGACFVFTLPVSE